MSLLAKIFTWWNGATIGTHLFTSRRGEKVGEDAQGNVYYRAKRKRGRFEKTGSPVMTPAGGTEKRWVIYNGPNDSSRVPPEWHGWLHGQFDDVPESFLPPARIWEAEHTPNATGTPDAYRPQGALEMGGKRARTIGDYEAWSPDGDDSGQSLAPGKPGRSTDVIAGGAA